MYDDIGTTSKKPTPYLLVLRLKSYKINTAYGTVRGVVTVIFGKCDPSYGSSPCSSLISGIVSGVDGLSIRFLQCNMQSIWPLESALKTYTCEDSYCNIDDVGWYRTVGSRI